MAAVELEAIHQNRAARRKEAPVASPPGLPPLLEWIPKVSPTYEAPLHLKQVADLLEDFQANPFDFVFSVPPRFGKTELILHFIVWALIKDPTLNICYVSYSADAGQAKSRRAMQIADAAGLTLTAKTAARWCTGRNEHVIWTGIGGPVTGKGFDIIIFDDPVKNRAEAESKTRRNRTWDFFQSDLSTRLEPDGSFICIQTRWHTDDLAGRLTRDHPEEDFDALPYVNIPAILDEGLPAERTLWDRWPLEVLAKRRRRHGEYAWVSLFMGRPRPRGSSVFEGTTFWSTLPRTYQVGRGVDLAYTDKTSADYSVIVRMLMARELIGDELADVFYVTSVVRKQIKAPEFRRYLQSEARMFRGAPMWMYGAAGPEAGAVDLLAVPELNRIQAVGDKFVRAQPFAEAWNDGRVLVPEDSDRHPWVDEFVAELLAFTGIKDPEDDQVDAGAAAFDSLRTVISDDDIPRRPRTPKARGLRALGK